MIRKISYVALITALTVMAVFAQTPSPMPTVQSSPQVSPTPVVSLATILTEAEKQTANYRETFKDLLAIEKKAFALRIQAETLKELERWAQEEFRSVNGQIEYLLNEALRKRTRRNRTSADDEQNTQANT